MTNVRMRLDRLRDLVRRPGCGQPGPYCAPCWDVRSDRDGPSDLPAICPVCGRPRLVRTIVLVGVDAGAI